VALLFVEEVPVVAALSSLVKERRQFATKDHLG
jgi:hypothetical protein